MTASIVFFIFSQSQCAERGVLTHLIDINRFNIDLGNAVRHYRFTDCPDILKALLADGFSADFHSAFIRLNGEIKRNSDFFRLFAGVE